MITSDVFSIYLKTIEGNCLSVFQKVFSVELSPGGSVTTHQDNLAKSYKVFIAHLIMKSSK